MSFVKFAACASLLAPALAISVDTTDDAYTVNTDSGNGFKTTVSRSNCDITSLIFRGTDYQFSGQKSHIASGLSSDATDVSFTEQGRHSCGLLQGVYWLIQADQMTK